MADHRSMLALVAHLASDLAVGHREAVPRGPVPGDKSHSNAVSDDEICTSARDA